MDPTDVARAVDAAMSIAVASGLPADDATVLHDSNKLALRLLPCDVFARVSPPGHEHATFEVDLARQFAAAGCPVAALDPRVEPRGYQRDGFEVTFWTFYELASLEISPAAYTDALVRLHAGMRTVDVSTPHYTDRVDEAEDLVASRERSPTLTGSDRELLLNTFRQLAPTRARRGAAEQLIHGEPHPGNVLHTLDGPLFIDLETCCRGPVEFDLAHVPASVSERYPDLDRALLGDCRRLVLAMVAAWRSDRDDQFPNGPAFGRELLHALRSGPPWPTIDEVFHRIDIAHEGPTP